MSNTAAMYDNERQVGEGIRNSGIARENLFVTTKVWWTDIASGDLERSAEASLKRLGLDHVDLLLIHWPNPQIALQESIRALNAARERALARHIGVSNFPSALLQEAVSLSEAPLGGKPGRIPSLSEPGHGLSSLPFERNVDGVLLSALPWRDLV